MKKSQAWYGDFVIAILLFSFTLVFYFAYTSNISKQNSIEFSTLSNDIKDISSSLILSGYPENWDNNTVIRIGLTNNDQRLDKDKWIILENMGYNKSKKILGTTNDFFIFFENNNGNVTNVEGFCGIGHPLVNTSYDVNASYYHLQDSDSLLKNFMENIYKADIYKKGEVGMDLQDFMDNLQNYGLAVMEHPVLSMAEFDSYKDDIESFITNGGSLIIGGQLSSDQDRELAGVKFHKKASQTSGDRNATVNITDEFFSYGIGQYILFAEANYVFGNTSATNTFRPVVRFNADQNIAISRWNFGGGSVLYSSDFDANYFQGDFLDALKDAIREWVGGSCSKIDLSKFSPKNLVKSERFIIYNSKISKMVLYLWQ